MPEGQRRLFREKIALLLQADRSLEWVISMCSWDGAAFDARLTAGVLRGASGRPLSLYWLMRAIGKPRAAE